MKPKATLLLLLLLSTLGVRAQWADTDPWKLHMSVGSTVASGFGQTQLLSWAAPSIEWHPNTRLTIKSGLLAAGNLLPTYELKGRGERDLAPLRQGTRVNALWASAEYKVADRLSLWGAVAHLFGMAQPLWLDHSLPVQTTILSGGFRYAVTENSLFEMHFHFIKDNSPIGFLSPIGPMSPISPISPIGTMGLYGPLDL